MTDSDSVGSIGDVEQWLIDVCRQLGVPVEGVDDDLFDVGGNSLTVVRLVARSEAEFGEEALTADELFEHSTVREIAACIRRHQGRVQAVGER